MISPRAHRKAHFMIRVLAVVVFSIGALFGGAIVGGVLAVLR